jgi:hypothetical protein
MFRYLTFEDYNNKTCFNFNQKSVFFFASIGFVSLPWRKGGGGEEL